MSVELAKKRILDQVPLERLIAEETEVSHKSGKPMACCPFHNEKSPSFVIYEDHYHCFGCQAHGDAITFVRQKKGLGYMDALRHLADKYQIVAPELDQIRFDKQQAEALTSFYRLLQAAQETLVEVLQQDPSAQMVRDYLIQRGFAPECFEELGFGYCPDQPGFVVDSLQRQGFSSQDMTTASLGFVSTRSGRVLDFFRHRLTVPIHDHHGRIIGFGGRSLGSDKPKYKNSRDWLLFDKSRVLFGFHKARDAIKSKGRAIVVEGYLDALRLWQAGFPETVACMGTALTLPHLRALSQACRTLYLAFDGDQAGQQASLKTVNLAIQVPQLSLKVIRLPEGHDPDSLVRDQGPEGLTALLEKSEDLLTFAMANKLALSSQLGIPHLIGKEFIPWLKTIQDPIYRSFIVGQLSDMSRMPRHDIEKALSNKTSIPVDAANDARDPGGKDQVAAMEPPSSLDPIVETLMGHLFFALPDELSPTQLADLEHWLGQYLDLHPFWQDSIVGFLGLIKKGLIPADQPLASLPGSGLSVMVHLIETFKNSMSLYVLRTGDSRQQNIERLQRAFQIEQLKKSKQQLRERLSRLISSGAEQDDVQQVLRGIHHINQKVKDMAAPL